ncbi:hypothetical protein HPB50_010003 [Hyalomma asiaticum]|uniref:Uncharacterized protein n=1 Tax=Hyalomma asiaticum TaxID=266040 RepID=A0ACB7T0Q2_HYAAI|nr:hypothetical protein HPB50_010003 [Hyalomma asiaticum]
MQEGAWKWSGVMAAAAATSGPRTKWRKPEFRFPGSGWLAVHTALHLLVVAQCLAQQQTTTTSSQAREATLQATCPCDQSWPVDRACLDMSANGLLDIGALPHLNRPSNAFTHPSIFVLQIRLVQCFASRICQRISSSASLFVAEHFQFAVYFTFELEGTRSVVELLSCADLYGFRGYARQAQRLEASMVICSLENLELSGEGAVPWFAVDRMATTTAASALHSQKNVVLRVVIPSGDGQDNEFPPGRSQGPKTTPPSAQERRRGLYTNSAGMA